MTRKFAAFALLALIPLGAAVPALAAGNHAPAGIIINLSKAGRCLAHPGSRVRVARCRPGAAGQAWRAYDPVAGIRIRTAGGRCLTATPDRRVIVSACGQPGQRWVPRGAFSLSPRRSRNRCLAMRPGGAAGLDRCRTRLPRQRWDWVRPAGS